jgi:ElaB/YqjD/DUF883 family membrane-anchored ribosome-binding protein
MSSIPNSLPGSETPASAEDALNRAVQGAHALVDRLAQTAGPAVDRLLSGVDSATEALQSGAEDFSELQERWVESCRDCVREHPLVSIGVAVAAGMLLNRLMTR